jgi:hypothetical protein
MHGLANVKKKKKSDLRAQVAYLHNNVFMNPNHLKHEIMLDNNEQFCSYLIETTVGLHYEK